MLENKFAFDQLQLRLSLDQLESSLSILSCPINPILVEQKPAWTISTVLETYPQNSLRSDFFEDIKGKKKALCNIKDLDLYVQFFIKIWTKKRFFPQISDH